MAKKKRDSAASDVLPLTPANVLISLLNQSKRTAKKVGDINSAFSASVAAAVETKHLHRGAFNVVRRLWVMEDEKLAEFHHFLMAYLDSSGINERVEAVERLPLDDDINVVSLEASAR